MEKNGKKRKTRKIAETIIAYMGKQVFIIFLLLAVVLSGLIWRQVMTSRVKELTLESKSVSYQLADFFEPYIQMVKQMAMDPEIKDILRNTKAGDDIRQAEGYDTFLSNIADLQQEDAENILFVWISDIDASVLTQSDGFTTGEGWDMTEREWYSCIGLKEPVMTNPYLDTSTNKSILSAVAPIYDDDGTAIGVAGVDITLDHAVKILSSYKIGEEGYITFVSPNGTVVYHPSEEKHLVEVSKAGFSQSFMDAVSGSEESFVRYRVDGDSQYGYVSFMGDTGYVVASALSTSEYFRNLFVIIVIMLAIFIIGFYVNYIGLKKMASKISKPLVHLDETAQKLAEGDLHVEIQIAGDAEIEELGRSIGKTVNRLKEYISYIEEISYALKEMANGNLNVELKQEYVGEFASLKEGIYNISSSMTGVLSNIRESAQQVSAGADDLANASQALAEGATTQAAAIEELTATSVTVAEQVEASGKEAEASAAQTARADEMVNRSQEQMQQMTEAMDKINETSKKVVSIIQTIQEIADQTNLLALNASIEAARAGEAGRGFAVVADEIGKLADESSKAANTTRELIGVSISEIGKGTKISGEVMASLHEVVDAVANVSEMINNTARNAMLQAGSIEQIHSGIEDISHAVQDNSAMAEQSSATSQELAAQAATLNELVQQFQLKE